VNGRLDPLGAQVRVDVELDGFRGKSVMLYWSLIQQGTGARLYGTWLSNHLAYQLKATTDMDTGSVEFWVPLPKAPGPYFVRIEVRYESVAVASDDSTPFN